MSGLDEQPTIDPTDRVRGAAQHRSFGRNALFTGLTLAVGCLVGCVLCEGTFRALELRDQSHISREGPGGISFPDGRWGWKPSIGPFKRTTSEFSVTGTINSLYMNDVPFVPGSDDNRTRILALGDSHTYAIGVSANQTWPKVLEAKLNAARPDAFRVYNGGVIGFNLHQDLLRLIDQGPIVKPHYVVLGLTYATNLFNLLPPSHGGWIYGDNLHARDYFDFDDSGHLVERHWLPAAPGSDSAARSSPAMGVRSLMGHLATFRYLRRSKLSLFVGSHVKVGGQTLWPNVEIILEKQVADQHRYQWKLFEALLDRINEEAKRQHAQLVVVGIPYLPQIYDEIWQLSFGKDPRFSRTAGIERVRAMCLARGIPYVDALDPMRDKSKQLGRWVNYHDDGHPTAEGHEAIAETIYRAGLIQPRAQGRSR